MKIYIYFKNSISWPDNPPLNTLLLFKIAFNVPKKNYPYNDKWLVCLEIKLCSWLTNLGAWVNIQSLENVCFSSKPIIFSSPTRIIRGHCRGASACFFRNYILDFVILHPSWGFHIAASLPTGYSCAQQAGGRKNHLERSSSLRGSSSGMDENHLQMILNLSFTQFPVSYPPECWGDCSILQSRAPFWTFLYTLPPCFSLPGALIYDHSFSKETGETSFLVQ